VDAHGKVVLLFAGMGVFAGIVSAFIGSGWVAFLLMLALYYLTYRQAPQLLKLQPSEFPRINIAKAGIVPIFVAWLVSWIWVYTLLIG
jgi:hypothetical protein